MKRSSSSLFVAVICAASAWSQATTPQTTSPPAKPPTTSAPLLSTTPAVPSLRARGPEAIAQQDPNRVVAVINGKQLTAKEALEILKPLSADDRKRFESNLSAVVQQLYMTGQLSEEATKLKLDQQSPWKDQLQLARANILTQAYLQKEASAIPVPGSDDPKAYFDSHTADYETVRLSGIVVAFSPPGTPAGPGVAQRTEAQALEKANDLEKKLKGGTDFATLAKSDSDQQQSSVQGGNMGSFAMGDANVPASIKGAVMKLQPTQISEPVRVQGGAIQTGFYIFRVDGRNTPTYDQARASITQKMQTDRNQAALKQALEKYKLDVKDPDFFNISSTPSLLSPPPQKPPSAPATAPAKPAAAPKSPAS